MQSFAPLHALANLERSVADTWYQEYASVISVCLPFLLWTKISLQHISMRASLSTAFS